MRAKLHRSLVPVIRFTHHLECLIPEAFGGALHSLPQARRFNKANSFMRWAPLMFFNECWRGTLASTNDALYHDPAYSPFHNLPRCGFRIKVTELPSSSRNCIWACRSFTGNFSFPNHVPEPGDSTTPYLLCTCITHS